MPQIVKPEIPDAGAFQCGFKRAFDVSIGLAGTWIEENIGAIEPPGEALQGIPQCLIYGNFPARAILCLVQSNETMPQVNRRVPFQRKNFTSRSLVLICRRGTFPNVPTSCIIKPFLLWKLRWRTHQLTYSVASCANV